MKIHFYNNNCVVRLKHQDNNLKHNVFIKNEGNKDCFVSGASGFKTISFSGIVDDLAGLVDHDDVEKIKKNVACEYPPPNEDELLIARRITSWNMDNFSQMNSAMRDILVHMYHPSSDAEIHDALVKYYCSVPSKPPAYVRNFDIFFKTKKWKEYQNWEEYIKKSILRERIALLVRRERLRKIKEKQFLLEQQAQLALRSAYVKHQLTQNFLVDFNSSDENKKIPNAILLTGKNEPQRREMITWLVGKTNANFIAIPSNSESNTVKLNQITSALENAQEIYKSNGIRTILYVEDFAKMLKSSPENSNVIADLKDVLCSLAEDYKTTLIFDAEDTKGLDSIALQPHRVGLKLNLDKNISMEELKKMKKDYLLKNLAQTKDKKGYIFNRIPNVTKGIKLYLGKHGYQKDVLWVDSTLIKDIQVAIENFDIIKEIPLFSNVTKIHFPKPTESLPDDIQQKATPIVGKLTKKGLPMYEYKFN